MQLSRVLSPSLPNHPIQARPSLYRHRSLGTSILRASFTTRPNPFLVGRKNLPKKIGFLTGGGPAPGLNSVIAAGVLAALRLGIIPIGIFDGWRHLMQGNAEAHIELTEQMVNDFALKGGTHIRTKRDNPAKSKDSENAIAKVLQTLEALGIEAVIAIGGDDTAYSASQIVKASLGKIRIASVPKTIDNDLPLIGMPTFGFETAREVGAQSVRNLLQDAASTGNWFLVVSMGRAAGHLALGIGHSAGVTNTIIPEEFGSDPEQHIAYKHAVDLAEASIIKSLALDKPAGVIVVAEGIINRLSREEKMRLFGDIPKDSHGNLDTSKLPLATTMADELEKRFKTRGQKIKVVGREVGYELRAANPNAFDVEYTKALGYYAVQFLCHEPHDNFHEEWGGLITLNADRSFMPIPYHKIINHKNGRIPTRRVDVTDDAYAVARQHMVRLVENDWQQNHLLSLARAANMTVPEFQDYFGYLVAPRSGEAAIS